MNKTHKKILNQTWIFLIHPAAELLVNTNVNPTVALDETLEKLQSQ